MSINKIIKELAQKPCFKIKKDWIKILEFDRFDESDAPDQFEPYEYLPEVRFLNQHDMS